MIASRPYRSQGH